MYAVRGGWVGQTFALATSNDSGERKSRTRRSKEERKAMAESFIKRYQSSNEGNFPSLNLTHKEVGGSFYTVREIVREIIQENKVLGPARCASEVKKNDTISEGYPLGSISTEPQDLLHQSEDESNVVSNHDEQENLKQTLDVNMQHSNQDLQSVECSSDERTGKIGSDTNEFTGGSEDHLISIDHEHRKLEPSLNSNGHCWNENDSDNGKSMNVIHTIGLSEESDKLLVKQSVKENAKADGKLGLLGAYNAKLTLPTKEVEVETFPLRPAIKETDETGTTSIDSGDRNGSLNNSETKQAVSSNGSAVLDQIASSDSPSDLVSEKGADGSEFSNLGGDSGAVTQHAAVSSMLNPDREVNLESKSSLEMPGSSTIKKDVPPLIHGHINQVASNSDLIVRTAEQSKELDGLQGAVHGENSSKTSSKNAGKEPIFMATNGYDTSICDQPNKGTSPTLDRINLESWPRTSKQETNPFLAFIKSFKDAFVKFWSD